MSIKIYKTPLVIVEGEIWAKFVRGAWIAYNKKPGGNIEIIAKCGAEEYLVGVQAVRGFENAGVDAEAVMIIPATPRTLRFRPPLFSKPTDALASPSVADYIKRSAMVYPGEKVKLIVVADHFADIMLIIGATVNAAYDTKSLSARMDMKIELFELHADDQARADLISGISIFTKTTKYVDFHNAIAARVLGQAELYKVTAAVYLFLMAMDNGEKIHPNVLIAGESGSGKTETFRALKEYFGEHVPQLCITMFDATQFTGAGYKGSNTAEIFDRLSEEGAGGHAIVYIDEFDKKLIPDVGSRGVDYNAMVQSELLSMMEGNTIKRGNKTVDFSKVMFILGGSFSNIRNTRASEKIAGFGDLNKPAATFDPITRDEIIDAGAMYELLGRIQVFANYRPLDDSARRMIIERKIRETSVMVGLPIAASDNYINKLVSMSELSRFGCRVIDQRVYEDVVKQYHETMLNECNGKIELD